MTFSLVIALYAVMAFLSSIVLLSTHKRVRVKELIFLMCAYGAMAGALLGAFAFGMTHWHFAVLFAALMIAKPLLFALICRDYTLTTSIISFVFSDVVGLMGAAFILIVPAIWDFVTSLYLILCTFLPPMVILGYFLYKKQFALGKAEFLFVVYPLFSIAALCAILYFGLTRGIFSTTAKVALDPAVVLPVMASAFLLFPGLRALLYKLKFKDVTWKDALILFYAADISGTILATVIWLLVKYISNAPSA